MPSKGDRGHGDAAERRPKQLAGSASDVVAVAVEAMQEMAAEARLKKEGRRTLAVGGTTSETAVGVSKASK